MNKKIIKNLLNIHKVPNKVFHLIAKSYHQRKYKKNFYEDIQKNEFKKLELNREIAQEKLDQLKNQYNFLNRSMSSEHQVLFSAFSLSSKYNFKNILEIGTFDGTNAFLLSKLFSNAKITTLDLKDEDNLFKESYSRENNDVLKKFCRDRDELIKKCENIKFEQKNSINLIFNDNKFDLIWIDGAHGYPVVTIDIINSLRLLNKDGVIICDDVWTSKPRVQDPMYNSLATFETLNVLKKSNFIDYNLIYKRLNKEGNSDPLNRKYIAILKPVNR